MSHTLITYGDTFAMPRNARGGVSLDFRSRAGIAYTLHIQVSAAGLVCPVCHASVSVLLESYRKAFAVCPACAERKGNH